MRGRGGLAGGWSWWRFKLVYWELELVENRGTEVLLPGGFYTDSCHLVRERRFQLELFPAVCLILMNLRHSFANWRIGWSIDLSC
jgi:hypothetical protein